MTCPRCQKPVPPGQLVCLCFQRSADEEAERLALQRFVAGMPLYMSETGHLAGRRGDSELALCRKLRINTRGKHTVALPGGRFAAESLQRMWGPRCCKACYDSAAAAMESARGAA